MTEPVEVDFVNTDAEETSGQQRAHSSLSNPISRFGGDKGRLDWNSGHSHIGMGIQCDLMNGIIYLTISRHKKKKVETSYVLCSWSFPIPKSMFDLIKNLRFAVYS